MPLVTPQDITSWYPALVNHSKLDWLINVATNLIEQECQRVLARSDDPIVEIHERVRETLILKEYPVSDLILTDLGTNQTISSQDYVLTPSNGIIIFYRNVYSCRIQASYKGGYSSIPDGLSFAAIALVGELATQLRYRGNSDKQASEGLPSERKTVETEFNKEEFLPIQSIGVMSDSIKRLLWSWKRRDR